MSGFARAARTCYDYEMGSIDVVYIKRLFILAVLAAISGCAHVAPSRMPAAQEFEPVSTTLTNLCQRDLDQVLHSAWRIGDRENPDVMRVTAQIINKQAHIVNFRCLSKYGLGEFSRCKFEVLERGNAAYWELSLDVDNNCHVFGALARLLAPAN